MDSFCAHLRNADFFPLLSDDPAVQSIIQLLILAFDALDVNFGILSSAKRGLVEE